jgi:glycosyltransferase involved in cell wall biosynthesis
MKTIASSPDLSLSGANVLLADVFSGFSEKGHRTTWLVTGHQGAADGRWLSGFGLDFQNLKATAVRDVTKRQRLLIESVREISPCVYFPNYDFDMLWAVEAFPASCRVVFIVHCDDPVYYEAIQQRGQVMDAIVCVSAYLSQEVKQRWPELADRVHHIPFGVNLPNGHSSKPSLAGNPLDVVYCGRLSEEQKRVSDLSEIILKCHARNLPVRFQIAGSGPDEEAIFTRLEDPLKAGRLLRLGKLTHDQVGELLGRCHVFILTSAYEGLPVSLLEAMAHGCVPVVTAVESGIPEVITEGLNGFMLPIGDVDGFAKRLEQLCGDEPALQACARAAEVTVGAERYSREACLNRYTDLCSNLMESQKVLDKTRGTGRVITPPQYRWQYRLRARFGL